MHLYGYFKEWRQNPQWSLSCCLALLLPLNDLQGDVTGMAGTNVLNNQIQTGQVDMPTLLGAVKDSSAVDVTFKRGEQEQKQDTTDVEDGENVCQRENIKEKINRGTQTGISSLSVIGVEHCLKTEF